MVTTGKNEQAILQAIEYGEPIGQEVTVVGMDAIGANGEHSLQTLRQQVAIVEQGVAAQNRSIQPELGEQGAIGAPSGAAERFANALDVREFALGNINQVGGSGATRVPVGEYIEGLRLDR